MLSCFVGIVYSFGSWGMDHSVSAPWSFLRTRAGGSYPIWMLSCFVGIVYSFGIELRDGPLSPCTLELHEGWEVHTLHECFLVFQVLSTHLGVEGWTSQFLHPGAPWVAGGSCPIWMLSCFSGIVYSFGIELRDGPLSPFTLELPEWQEVHTVHECFLVL